MTMEAEVPKLVQVAHVSDLLGNQLTVVKPITIKEDKLHGAMSEEVADSMSVESQELIEELPGVTAIPKNPLESTQDADKSLTSVKKLAVTLLPRLVTSQVVKDTKWLETGAKKAVTPTTVESTRDMDTTVFSEPEKSPKEDK
jgi:hypothetical protein